jgi:hypothetical protein
MSRNNPLYKIDDTNWKRYQERFNLLEMKTQVWPPTLQVQHLSHKWELIRRLDFISDEMDIPRPITQVLSREDSIPTCMVLKRSHSDCGSKVIFPAQHRRMTWEDLKDVSEPPESTWMAQELVPQLKTLGEWRALLVDGEIVYVVHTNYDENRGTWVFEKVGLFYTLGEMR